MSTTTPKAAFWEGVRAGLPFVLVLIPFAALFGIVATEAGLNIFEALMFSVAVIAGAAQFTALHLLAEETPTLIVITSALAVNLRMAMYSASLAPHLAKAPLWKKAFAAYMTLDQTYALSINKYEQTPDMTLAQKLAFFFGVACPMVPCWYVFTLVGAWGGKTVPDTWALDFALPITFLAMIGPMLRTLPHMIAAFVSVVCALLFAGVPYNLGLLMAAVLAMMAGAQSELWLTQKEPQDG